MKNFTKLVVAAFLLALPSAQATLLQLDFSGQLVSALFDADTPAAGSFSGTLIIDSAVSDSRPEDNLGRYTGAILSASVIMNGVSYTPVGSGGLFNDVYINNDQDLEGDLFVVALDIVDDGGAAFTLGLQLQDLSLNSLANDAFPEVLSLFDFDEFDPNNSNTTSGIFFSLDNSTTSLWGSLDSLELRAVPVPAAVWLLLSGIALLGGVRKKR